MAKGLADDTVKYCRFFATAVLIGAVLFHVFDGIVWGQRATGVIQGIVKAPLRPTTTMLKVTSDQQVCGDTVPDEAIVVNASGAVANAVIRVPGVPWPGAPAAPSIQNTGCLFAPRVQLAEVRSQVAITSEDDVLHNTHAYDDLARTLFNIAVPIPGMTITRPLQREGLVRLECDVHEWMRGWILVTPEVATTTGPDGRFTLKEIPAGTHEVVVWHEKLSASPQMVEVPAGRTVELVFALQ